MRAIIGTWKMSFAGVSEAFDMLKNGVPAGEAAVHAVKTVEDNPAFRSVGFGGLPVCIAKTQYSFSDDASLLGAPEGFRLTIRSMKVSAGAGFVVALAGDIMTMPGLPKRPAAEKIDVDSSGRITGLF